MKLVLLRLKPPSAIGHCNSACQLQNQPLIQPSSVLLSLLGTAGKLSLSQRLRHCPTPPVRHLCVALVHGGRTKGGRASHPTSVCVCMPVCVRARTLFGNIKHQCSRGLGDVRESAQSHETAALLNDYAQQLLSI